MAMFGAPVALEDDPERAVRVAQAVRDWVREEEQIPARAGGERGGGAGHAGPAGGE
jgi:hypothetical protein